MEEIQYVGELLWPGQLANFCLYLSFCSAILAAVAYYLSVRNEDKSWCKIANTAFIIHSVAILTVITTIFYLMISHRFEYRYVLEHVSADLPMRYIFSAFWEGQEGSFLLWMFWHVILGLIILFRKSEWRAPVLAVLSLIQVVLLTMILGAYLGWGDSIYRLGSNPLLLLRDTMDIPLFQKADYVSLLQGNGLNPLLQNYWNTIHPPTLFLGFASTTIPFCFAIAGLWTRKDKAWLTPALKWSLFSGAILGTGILMGGAWAYEALTFGGYWAWDPVENASLVPWLLMLAGIHTNLIAKKTGHAIRATYIFYILAFVMIVYSTFLTRSGVLGETSVHAFTEMGLEWQLIIFLALFTGMGLFLIFKRYKSIPSPVKEESFSSREFWMFIGSLVLLFSAILISGSTSLPVFNKIVNIFDPDYVGLVINDDITHYNKYQVWIAVFISLLSSCAIYLRYGADQWKYISRRFFKHIAVAALLAIFATIIFTKILSLYTWQYYVLMFTSAFAVFANIDYLITSVRGNLKLGASALAHAGFGIMIIGVLASGLNKRIISSNPFAFREILATEKLGEVIKLYERIPMFMDKYWVTYVSDTLVGHERKYTLDFRQIDENQNTVEEFTLHPTILYDKEFTRIAAANPSIRRYINRDIFTNVDELPASKINVEYAHAMEDSLIYDKYKGAVGDTIFGRQCYGIIKSIDYEPRHMDFKKDANDLGVGLTIEFKKLDEEKSYLLYPTLALQGNLIYQYPDNQDELNLKVRLSDSLLNQFFTPPSMMDYSTVILKKGGNAKLNGHQFELRDLSNQPDTTMFRTEEGDIGIQAFISVTPPNEDNFVLKPIYVIRGNKPNVVPDYHLPSGLHMTLTRIDPVTGELTFEVAWDKRNTDNLSFEMAENVPRTDFIVLQAREFPGINLFWLGSVLMMIGLSIAMYNRIKEK